MTARTRERIASAALVIGFFVDLGGDLPRLRGERHHPAAP